MNACFLTIEQIIKELKSDQINGLTETKVTRARKFFGRNSLQKVQKTSLLALILEQFKDRLVLILLVSAVISLFLGLLDNSNSAFEVLVEPAVILLILIANAAVGVSQEVSAAGAIEKLKDFESKRAFVLRMGSLHEVEASDLVPGDILQLSVGQRIPADCRVVEIKSVGDFMCDESMLTGETMAKVKSAVVLNGQKQIVVQDMNNILFSGTLAVKGSCMAVVVKTGQNTELGKIQSQLEEINAEKNKTPLQQQLDVFADYLSKLILGVCLLVWCVNFNHFADPEHGGFIQGAVYYFKIAVTLAVAAIPEGLPAVVTTCLALGTSRMARKRAIVRSLPSVETLGCTTVICSDKTGTITTNQMSVRNLLVLKNPSGGSGKIEKFIVSGESPCTLQNSTDNSVTTSPLKIPPVRMITQIGRFCNEAALVNRVVQNDVQKRVAGIPTEVALQILANKMSFARKGRRLALFDFDRSRKMMSTVDAIEPFGETAIESAVFCHVKGAPEYLFSRCDSVLVDSGDLLPLSETTKDLVLSEMEKMASEGLRLLGFAYKKLNSNFDSSALRKEKTDSFYPHENHLTFAGIAAMLDPPRAEVPRAVQRCLSSGVQIKVITGDHKSTAEAICKEIGLLPQNVDSSLSLTGQEFMALSRDDQMDAADRTVLFSRVEPQHKLKLVRLLKQQGQVVAMTGDGVNDAAALRCADIGVAMGSGTQVACEAADMILQDDNFDTIVSAVEEGRSIYANTKQFIRYLISSNIGEVVSVFLTAFIGLPEALAPVQLLWVNLVTDGLPATALGFNPPAAEEMKLPPRKRTESLIGGWLLFRYVLVGCYIGAATVLGLVWWFLFYSEGPRITFNQLKNFHSCGVNTSHFSENFDCSIFKNASPSTISLSILVTIEMLNAFNAISENASLFVVTPLNNIFVVLAVCLSFFLHFLILYVPFLRGIFSTAALGLAEWIAVLVLSFPVIAIDEVLKSVTRNCQVGTSKIRRARMNALRK